MPFYGAVVRVFRVAGINEGGGCNWGGSTLAQRCWCLCVFGGVQGHADPKNWQDKGTSVRTPYYSVLLAL